jgi:hypothetical protein
VSLPALAADLVVLVHLAFVVFVVLGGLLVLRWPRAAWAHLPAAVYGALIELVGWGCPLTPLENDLRRAAGEAGHEGGFIEHYLVPILYPHGLTPTIQVVLGVLVVTVNLAVYATAYRRHRGMSTSGGRF